MQSLKAFNNIYWIVGGLPKQEDVYDLRDISHKIKKAYIIGKSTSFFKKKLKNFVECSIVYNLKKALQIIFKDIKQKSETKCTILLSPAAASFDQFENFETRGGHFKYLTKKKLRNFSYV